MIKIHVVNDVGSGNLATVKNGNDCTLYTQGDGEGMYSTPYTVEQWRLILSHLTKGVELGFVTLVDCIKWDYHENNV